MARNGDGEKMTPPQSPWQTIAAFLSTKTGLSVGLISAALPIITAFAVDRFRAIHHYDKGWAAYEQALREGNAELDGKRVEILTADEQQALKDAAYLKGEMDGFKEAQEQHLKALEAINASHAAAIGAIGQRNFTPAEKDWRSVSVPDTTSLRLNRLIATRGSHSPASGLSNPRNGQELAGSVTGDSGRLNRDER